MTPSPCSAPLAEDSLVAYWCEELPEGQSVAIEDHVFGCADCAERMQTTAQLIEELRTLGREMPPPVISRTALNRLVGQGKRVLEYKFSPSPSKPVAQRIGDDVDVVVLTIPVDLSRVQRLDVSYCTPEGSVFHILEGAPFDGGATEILLACDRHVAAGHDAVRFRLHGHIDGERRELADVIAITGAA